MHQKTSPSPTVVAVAFAAAACCHAYARMPSRNHREQRSLDIHRPCKRPFRKSRNRITTMLAH